MDNETSTQRKKAEKENSFLEIFRIAAVLSVITIIASIALAVTYSYTGPIIEQRQELKIQEGLQKAVPDAEEFKETSPGKYDAYIQGEKIGEIMTIFAKGYGGKIKMLVGMTNEKDKVLGIFIIDQLETPGLGARITEILPGETDPWFQTQFSGLATDDIRLSKNGGKIDAIAAATISSKAVTDVVYEALKT